MQNRLKHDQEKYRYAETTDPFNQEKCRHAETTASLFLVVPGDLSRVYSITCKLHVPCMYSIMYERPCT